MKIFAVLALCFCLFAVARAQTFYGTTDLKVFREGRDKEFRSRTESPLKDEDFAGFKGLNYYATSDAFRVTATLKRTDGAKTFRMPTSSGATKKLVKYGILTFKLNGKLTMLSVYQSDAETRKKFPEYAHLLFIPFKDATNRTDTYGGGRYIDIVTPKDDKVILDFNLAYNPNCAYGSDKYSCPIPPRENRLRVAIRAGEKRYAYAGARKRLTEFLRK
ncbi:MAG: DUF1684 domain-containing protein [Pyrinomonadaceae bacterium]